MDCRCSRTSAKALRRCNAASAPPSAAASPRHCSIALPVELRRLCPHVECQWGSGGVPGMRYDGVPGDCSCCALLPQPPSPPLFHSAVMCRGDVPHRGTSRPCHGPPLCVGGSDSTLSHCLGAVGSETSAVHCHTAWGRGGGGVGKKSSSGQPCRRQEYSGIQRTSRTPTERLPGVRKHAGSCTGVSGSGSSEMGLMPRNTRQLIIDWPSKTNGHR